MNLPNRITLGRLFLSVLLFGLLQWWPQGSTGFPWYATFTLFLLVALGDGLDGYIARSRGQITTFGRIADPFADKILIGGVLVLEATLPETRALVPAWLVILVLGREFLVSGLRGYLEGRGVTFAARWEGKTKMVVQAFFCGTVLFYPGSHFEWVLWLARIGLWITVAVTLWSAVTYVRRAAEVLGAGPET